MLNNYIYWCSYRQFLEWNWRISWLWLTLNFQSWDILKMLYVTLPPFKICKDSGLNLLENAHFSSPVEDPAGPGPRVAFWMLCDFTPWVACSQTLHFLLKVRRARSPIIEKKNKETSVCRLRFGRHLGLAGCHNCLWSHVFIIFLAQGLVSISQ